MLLSHSCFSLHRLALSVCVGHVVNTTAALDEFLADKELNEAWKQLPKNIFTFKFVWDVKKEEQQQEVGRPDLLLYEIT